MTRTRAIETIEDTENRLQAALSQARQAREKCRGNLITALQQFATADELAAAAQANLTKFQVGRLSDVLHDIEPLKIAAA